MFHFLVTFGFLILVIAFYPKKQKGTKIEPRFDVELVDQKVQKKKKRKNNKKGTTLITGPELFLKQDSNLENDPVTVDTTPTSDELNVTHSASNLSTLEEDDFVIVKRKSKNGIQKGGSVGSNSTSTSSSSLAATKKQKENQRKKEKEKQMKDDLRCLQEQRLRDYRKAQEELFVKGK
jgi:hypothetical protein